MVHKKMKMWSHYIRKTLTTTFGKKVMDYNRKTLTNDQRKKVKTERKTFFEKEENPICRPIRLVAWSIG